MVYISIINYTLHYTSSSSSYMFHGDLLWAAFMFCSYTFVPERRLNRTDRFYTVAIQIWIIQLLTSIENFSPLRGFEPRTSPVPSLYASNWAILMLIIQCHFILIINFLNSTYRVLIGPRCTRLSAFPDSLWPVDQIHSSAKCHLHSATKNKIF